MTETAPTTEKRKRRPSEGPRVMRPLSLAIEVRDENGDIVPAPQLTIIGCARSDKDTLQLQRQVRHNSNAVIVEISSDAKSADVVL